jgi:hypothetical protein
MSLIDFGSRLRSLCGLFISVFHDRVYFFHETAREFLLTSSGQTYPSFSGPTWQHSITDQHAHAVLAEVCVFYLDFSISILRAGNSKKTVRTLTSTIFSNIQPRAGASIALELVSLIMIL